MSDPSLTVALDAELRSYGKVVVAFSGGVDSAYLAWRAREVLGRDRVVAATAVSPSLAAAEREHCAELAELWDLEWVEVFTDEMENAAYRSNDANRCAHCKDALMDAVGPLAEARSATVVLGVNLDDLGDHRPGQQAAAQRGARFPMVDAGWTKQQIRDASRAAGLPTWDKPAAPCLASRLPYGIPVTLGRLSTIERAEAALRNLGFRELRVRHYHRTARVEFAAAELPSALQQEATVVRLLNELGYDEVNIDPAGLRSGNLNDVLDLTAPRSAAAGSISGD